MRSERIVALGLAAIVLRCGGGGPAAPPAPPPAPVTTAVATTKVVPVEIAAIGNVEASSVVEVRARVGGELEAVHFKEGQQIAKGALLFTIDPRPYKAALAGAEAKLARDEVLAQNSSAEVARYEKLVEKEYVTREQYDRSVAMAAAAEALAKGDEAAAEAARLELGYCSITSPIAGRAGEVLLRAGNLVKANADDPMVVLRQTRPVFVSFAVPERQLGEIRTRMAAASLEVEVRPGAGAEARRGRLTFVDNTVNTTTGTIGLKATFPNDDDALWPGQFVDAVLILETQTQAVVIPAEAVQSGQQGTYVFVVKDDSTVDSRPVEIERTRGADAVVARGIEPGERVVTEGQLRLVPGARVAPREGS